MRSPPHHPQLRDRGRKSFGWSIAICLNLIFVISFTLAVSSSALTTSATSSFQSLFSDTSDFFSSLRVGFLCALIFTIVHLLYACTFPVFYIKFASYFGFIFTISTVLFFSEVQSDPHTWIFGVISLIGSIFWFYYCKSRIAYTSVLLRETSIVLLSNPLLFVLQIAQVVVSVIFAVVLIGGIYLISNYAQNFVWSVLWLLVSYFWVVNTLYYSFYLAGAGTAASHFYDGNGEVWRNVVRAFGSLFGIASLCGFVLGLVQTLRVLLKMCAKSRRQNEENENNLGWIGDIADFLLEILEDQVHFISRYSLLFCGIHGCSLREGFRRFQGQSCESVLKRMRDQSILNAALNIHNVLFVGVAILGVLVIGNSTGKEDVVALGATLVFGLAAVELVKVPFMTVSEALQLCFLEAPGRTKSVSEDFIAQSRRFKE
jgi:hypothetical protein